MPASDIAGGKMHDSLQDFVSLAVNRTYQATGLDLSFSGHMEDIAGKDLTSLKANANKVSNLQEIVDLFESQCADQLKQLYTYTDSKKFGTQVNLNVINPTLAYLFIAAQQYGLRPDYNKLEEAA